MPEYTITWTINGEGDTPYQAALAIWQDIFGRSVAGPDDSCVFQVRDEDTGEEVEVDLSEAEDETCGNCGLSPDNGDDYDNWHDSQSCFVHERPAYEEANGITYVNAEDLQPGDVLLAHPSYNYSTRKSEWRDFVPHYEVESTRRYRSRGRMAGDGAPMVSIKCKNVKERLHWGRYETFRIRRATRPA